MIEFKMFWPIFLFFIISGGNANKFERIVDGSPAYLGELPYIVSLQINNQHTCGGSILDETHILTAAHCVYGMQSFPFNIQYGVVNIVKEVKNRINVASIEWHSKYEPSGGYFNDIAILTLSKPIELSETAEKVKLPVSNDPIPDGTRAILAGWGYEKTNGTATPDLQKVDLVVYSDNDCERIHAPGTKRDYHVCAGYPEGGKGQCNGDSGGPLYANGVQIGIVSWSKHPCASKGYPGVFTRVSNYIDWIKSRINYK